MSELRKVLWSRYVDVVAGHLGKGTAISRHIDQKVGGGPSQSTVDRWLKGTIMPTGGDDVAAFARAFGRSPLEALVAAGVVQLEEAKDGLDAKSINLLINIDKHPYGTPRLEEERQGRRKRRMNLGDTRTRWTNPDGTSQIQRDEHEVDMPRAAHEEERDIEDEQVGNETA